VDYNSDRFSYSFVLPELHYVKVTGTYDTSFLGAISRGSPKLQRADVDFFDGIETQDHSALGVFLSKIHTWQLESSALLLRITLECPSFQPRVIEFGLARWVFELSEAEIAHLFRTIESVKHIEHLAIEHARLSDIAAGLPNNVEKIALDIRHGLPLVSPDLIMKSAMEFPGIIEISTDFMRDM